ncbi:ABC transporter substrate-binding protein [Allocoleopsis franciscana]|uniref:Amino acid/amide ABC transporter substrate-binding protein, HAAT family n=1 Tax=Allocoleopsis franciscana PCC 7113 TaxID=1173027 RepID=K9WPL7_9CYAN|nr:ABC transporter substrate-binding protein [Allocoleopsis franciscana]AFZ21492.1 amino acid/amide ABC transporter substrate-binding protein, HAAT family [Allocoleopsis franciscana PCC 7113]
METTEAVRVKKRRIPPIFYILMVGLSLISAPRFLGTFKSGSRSGSIGNYLLISEKVTSDKKQGIEAFAKGDYQQAIASFKNSLLQQPNDPETLIYLNNAQAGNDALKIAVSVPIGSNLNVAQEILRGVATAQAEINKNGGINGQKLQVQIVNDENDPKIARKLAQDLVNDPQVLGVLGHNSSDASLAAAPIYQKKGLVMISATSSANNLSGFGSYIFRTVPAANVMAETLADYAIKTARKTKIAFCYDSQTQSNVSFKDEFLAALVSKGGQLVPTVCDLSAPNFNPSTAVTQAINSGADGLFISSHIDRIESAIALAKANQGKLALFSSPTLYTVKTLQAGQQDVKGLALAAPWHPQVNPSFAQKMTQQWRGKVSWRTATAYDATQAMIAGLQQSQNREGLQQALHSQGFSVQGASGAVRFAPSGDRISQPVIVQVQSKGVDHDFVMLPTTDP